MSELGPDADRHPVLGLHPAAGRRHGRDRSVPGLALRQAYAGPYCVFRSA